MTRLTTTACIFAVCALAASSDAAAATSRIYNGTTWHATDGSTINAHAAGIYYEDGYYYWFGENRDGMRSNGVSVYRSTDLLNWDSLGLALTPEGERKNTLQDVAPGRTLERPKVIKNPTTGKYVMWAHWEDGEDYSKARVMVAQADKPEGPYTLVRTLRPNGQESRDQTIFRDDDNKAYHIRSSEENMTLQCSLLSDDYLAPTDTYERIIPGKQYEAPAILKINETYIGFFSGCTGWRPNPGHVCTTRDIMSNNWNDLGNPCVDDNASTTYTSQPTYALKLAGYDYAYMYLGDRWNSSNVQTSTYVWLPIFLRTGTPFLRYYESWDLSIFDTLDAIRRAAAIEDGNTYVLLSRLADRMVSLSAGKVCLYDDNDSKNLSFVFEATGEPDTYKLRRADTDSYLRASGSSVVLEDGADLETQKWVFERSSDNFYSIVSKATGKVLSVKDASMASGAEIELIEKTTAAKARFGVYFDHRKFDYEEDNPFGAPVVPAAVENVTPDAGRITLTIAPGAVTVSGVANVAKVMVYDVAGRCVAQRSLLCGGAAATMMLNNLNAGIYIVTVSDDNSSASIKIAL